MTKTSWARSRESGSPRPPARPRTPSTPSARSLSAASADSGAEDRVDGRIPCARDALRRLALLGEDPPRGGDRLVVAGAARDPRQQLVSRHLERLERIGEAGQLDRRVGLRL